MYASTWVQAPLESSNVGSSCVLHGCITFNVNGQPEPPSDIDAGLSVPRVRAAALVSTEFLIALSYVRWHEN